MSDLPPRSELQRAAEGIAAGQAQQTAPIAIGQPVGRRGISLDPLIADVAHGCTSEPIASTTSWATAWTLGKSTVEITSSSV